MEKRRRVHICLTQFSAEKHKRISGVYISVYCMRVCIGGGGRGEGVRRGQISSQGFFFFHRLYLSYLPCGFLSSDNCLGSPRGATFRHDSEISFL